MPRLPVPGSDTGKWGEILNDFLSQAHTSDGHLKTDSVTAGQLASGSVVTAALADGSVTQPKLHSAVQSSLAKADTAIQPADLVSEVRHAWNGTYSFMATAVVGSAESASVWRITRILVNADGSTTTGVKTNGAWTNRESEVYV